MLTVHTPEGVRRFEASKGQTLLSVLRSNGVFSDAPCGGNGTCGKCRVFVSGDASPLTQEERLQFNTDELTAGMRLACQTVLLGDAVARLPNAGGILVETEGIGEPIQLRPAVKRISLNVPDGSLSDQSCDMTRIRRELERTVSNLDSTFSLTAIRHAPDALRKQAGRVDAVLYRGRLLDVSTPDEPLLGMAVDIGTTTVAAYFFDLETGEQLAVHSAANPQRTFGADVISRIAASENGGLAEEQKAIVGLLAEMIQSFCKGRNVSTDRLYHATIAANTTMLHLLAGIAPQNIAVAPFLPATCFGLDFRASELALPIFPDAPVTLLPCISSYVGADITAGMAAFGLDRSKQKTLYIDVGTNGEMAYANGERILCCSTAAGPAFEGAHIECGSGGIPGAVRGAHIQDGKIVLEPIGGGKARTICGSGLIDLICILLQLEILDETGRLAEPDELEPPFDACINENGDFILDAETGLRLTAKDIREVQLAKAAVRAGICTLLDEVGETAETLDRLVVAGGFGAHIRPESACGIGLFPSEALNKYQTAGNAAGRGAILALLDEEASERMQRLAERCEYLELSGSKTFQNHYIEQMLFGEDV